VRPRFEGFKRNVAQHGLPVAIADSALSFVNKFGYDKILKGVTIDTPDARFLSCDQPYQGGFLSIEMLRDYVADPANQLDDAFLDRAAARRDECYGFLDDKQQLASYGWYSNCPAEMDTRGLELHFDPSYIYMYKGHTHPAHRGHRLHAVGMTCALQAYLERGFKGIVSYVEWNNFDSLKSCYRMGYKDFGNIYVARMFGRYLFYSDAGCRKYQFRLERSREEREGGEGPNRTQAHAKPAKWAKTRS
jgi:hypothetical protein